MDIPSLNETSIEISDAFGAVDPLPAFLGLSGQAVNQTEQRRSGDTVFRSSAPVANGRKGRLDGIRRADMPPMLGREIIESEQGLTVSQELVDSLRIFRLIGAHETLEGGMGRVSRPSKWPAVPTSPSLAAISADSRVR